MPCTIGQDPSVVSEISALLKCDSSGLTNALTTKRIKAGGDWIVSPVNPDVAANVRPELAIRAAEPDCSLPQCAFGVCV